MPRRGSDLFSASRNAATFVDRLAVHFRDDVFALNILRGRDAVVGHIGHDHALLDVEFQSRRNFLGQVLNLQAKLVRVFSRGCGGPDSVR